MRHILKIHKSLAEPLAPINTSYQICTFDPAKDKATWLALNNKTFAKHPDQGNWVLADLENRMAESWFEPSGFFLAMEDGQIVGFVWTKIHQGLVQQEPVGELFVVGVDPDHAKQGIGKALSTEAINYFIAKGLKKAMLYVDADNLNGLSLYTKLGFN